MSAFNTYVRSTLNEGEVLFPGEELRLYSFVNYYLSPIQHGIQTGHAAVDIVMSANAKTPNTTNCSEGLVQITNRWAEDFKTFIILNGGNNDGIMSIWESMQTVNLPKTLFKEDFQSLGGIATCCAIIVPQTLFDMPRDEIEMHVGGVGSDLFDFMTYLKYSQLAR